jgi:hypothetical protein
MRPSDQQISRNRGARLEAQQEEAVAGQSIKALRAARRASDLNQSGALTRIINRARGKVYVGWGGQPDAGDDRNDLPPERRPGVVVVSEFPWK